MPETLPVGSRFGEYEILEELGSGGMGKVYRAKDVTLERSVALKTLAPGSANDPAFVERFLREARAVARLNHPNIVQIYNFGSVEGTWYLAMEFVDGPSLGQRLRSGRFSEAEVVRITRQVCQALALAHAEGLVHRDIKPDNIMLTSRGDVKLVDLGIAKRLDEDQSLTQTGHSMGTPHYISPEQIRGLKDIDARADIYSLGATLYHLVTGHTPYLGASGAVVMSMHLVEPLPDPRIYEPALSDGFCSVLRKMMAKKREERYADVAMLDVDLFRLHVGQTPRPQAPAGPVFGSTADATLDLTTPAPPAFDPVLLLKIEENLATSIGPMARLLVKKAAKAAPSLEALCDELSRQLAPGADREAFCAKCMACGKTPASSGKPVTGPAKSPSGAGRIPTGPQPMHATPGRSLTPSTNPGSPVSTPAPAGAAFPDADLAILEVELARRIGPLARILVKKAVRAGGTYADLASRLEEHIPDEEGRRAFREAVRKTGR
jgi:serine/threonine-protein kinase